MNRDKLRPLVGKPKRPYPHQGMDYCPDCNGVGEMGFGINLQGKCNKCSGIGVVFTPKDDTRVTK